MLSQVAIIMVNLFYAISIMRSSVYTGDLDDNIDYGPLFQFAHFVQDELLIDDILNIINLKSKPSDLEVLKNLNKLYPNTYLEAIIDNI
jgi:hypothetical protein